MKFIELSDKDGPVFVRRKSVDCVLKDNGAPTTILTLRGNCTVSVLESPETVMRLVRGTPLQQLAECAE